MENPAYYSDTVKKFKTNDQFKNASMKIVNVYLNSMKIDKELMKDIVIDKVTHEKKEINDVYKDTIKIDYSDFTSMRIVKNHLKYFPKTEYTVNDFIPNELRDNYNVFKDIGEKYRKDNHEYRIWLKNNGYQIRVRSKGDKTYWPEIPPLIPPFDLPLANIGKINDTLRKEINILENQYLQNIQSKRDIRIRYKDDRYKESEASKIDIEDDTNNKRPRSEHDAHEISKKLDYKDTSSSDEDVIVKYVEKPVDVKLNEQPHDSDSQDMETEVNSS